MLISANFNQLNVYDILGVSKDSNASETLTGQNMLLPWTFWVKDVTKVYDGKTIQELKALMPHS